jgi:hypothetical protein
VEAPVPPRLTRGRERRAGERGPSQNPFGARAETTVGPGGELVTRSLVVFEVLLCSWPRAGEITERSGEGRIAERLQVVDCFLDTPDGGVYARRCK